ncbi:MAG: aspartate kinase, partial [Proteobacteria bacterium]|nr:aspartate kinase [Pseudomonadota bacterium]MBU4326289.1 aspartate kinase [Pseudomonadota bacterium]MBU4584645.1 aspartate kinase [Pseudomonadota bacterium]MCG2743278.1 aspartate kinase [Desulfobacteraceae bacterium]
MGTHTVEKIGGTSMSQFGDVLDNILIGTRREEALYNRIIVVSAYAGITNELLEHKKSSKSGV